MRSLSIDRLPEFVPQPDHGEAEGNIVSGSNSTAILAVDSETNVKNAAAGSFAIPEPVLLVREPSLPCNPMTTEVR